MRKSFAIFGLVAFAAIGCSTETVSSENIKTGGIAATIEVISDDPTHTNVWATLRVGGDESNTYVVLDNGDTLKASSGTESKNMSAESEGKYLATFGSGQADQEFKVMLDRADDTDANNNVGTLPAPFSITLPDANKSRASDDLTITWDASGGSDKMTIEVSGDCIFDYDETVADTGTYTIPKGELKSTGGDKPTTCTVDVRMERTRAGSTDSALDNESSMKLIQRRTVEYVSAP